jgi:polyketide synthase 12
MGAELAALPVFAAALADADAALGPLDGHPVSRWITAPPDPARLHATAITQPALLAFAHGLTAVWASWGVRPDVLLGHSLGELAAVAIAGGIDGAAALRLARTRGALMGELEGGAMLAAFAPASAVEELARAAGLACAPAAYNGPAQVIWAGPRDEIDGLARLLAAQRVEHKVLKISFGAHSAAVEPILARWREAAAAAPRGPLAVPVIGNLTGAPLAAAPDADAWVRHAREPVRFAEGVQALVADDVEIAIEIGPSEGLSDLARGQAAERCWMPSLRKEEPAALSLARAAAALLARGARLDGAAVAADLARLGAWR